MGLCDAEIIDLGSIIETEHAPFSAANAFRPSQPSRVLIDDKWQTPANHVCVVDDHTAQA
jgi:hypothetical protein